MSGFHAWFQHCTIFNILIIISLETDSEYDFGKESQDDEEEEKVADDKKLKKKIKKEPSDTPAKPRKIEKSNTTSLNHVKKTNQTSFTKPRKIDKSNKPAIVPSFEK